MDHIHECSCGNGVPTPHQIAEGGCKRQMEAEPVMTMDPEKPWRVDGNKITDYTLRHQRGYRQHPCGCWSSWAESKNSVDA